MLKKRGLAVLVFVIVGLTYVSYRIIPHLDWEYLTHKESPGMWTLLQAEFGDSKRMENIHNFYHLRAYHAAFTGDGDWCGRQKKAFYWLDQAAKYPESKSYIKEFLPFEIDTEKFYIELEESRIERNQNYQPRCGFEEVKNNA